MANSTITLFLSTSLHEEKRFAIEHIDQWLLGFTATEVKKFQYIKNQLNLSIKINMSQDGLEASSANDIDYVSITNSNETKVYYYFVVNKIWKSTETIEFVLKMDTLNTFEFDEDYEVNKKTFVRREHKDRIAVQTISNIECEPPSVDLVNRIMSGTLTAQESYWFVMDIEKFLSLNYTGGYGLNLFRSIYLDPEEGTRYFKLRIFRKNDGYPLFSNDSVISLKLAADNEFQYSWLVGASSFSDILDLTSNNYIIIVGFQYTEDTIDMGYDAEYQPEVLQIYFSQKFKGFQYGYKRIIDKFPENINPVLFKKSEEFLLDLDGFDNWYLVYANENAVSSADNDYSALYVNPVKLMFARDTSYKIITGLAVEVPISPSNITKLPAQGECLNVSNANMDAGAYVKIGGTTYNMTDTWGDGNYNSISIFKWNDGDGVFKNVYLYKLSASGAVASRLELNNVGQVIFKGIAGGKIIGFQGYEFDFTDWSHPSATGRYFYIGSSANGTGHTSNVYEDIDLTNSQLIKIIALPYAPLEFLNGIYTIQSMPEEVAWNITFDLLQIEPTKRINFDYIIDFGYVTPFKDLLVNESISSKIKKPRNDIYESKFYNSEFTQNKFVYDQYSFTFQLELINTTDFFAQESYDKFLVEYIVSKKLSSKFVFKFNQYTCKEAEKQDYNAVLIVDRNNEVPLFTNAYINYMRTGYQFDITNKNNQQISKWAGIALSTIGSIASFVSSPATGAVGIAGGIGLATSTIGQIVGAITTQNQQENAIAQKQLQASYQAESVQGSDDVELFKQYGQNKAKLVKYQPSEVMSKMIKDLFYYGGYATSEYKVPNIATRVYFNYLQCDLVIDHTNNVQEVILEDIINKFKDGVTIFHKFNGEWDIDQQYENFEVSI